MSDLERKRFEIVISWAENQGYEHRPDPSRAKDLSGLYVRSPWANKNYLVLYEAPRRTLRGQDKPEVCWWVVDCFGEIHSEASRNIRRMELIRGFGFEKTVAEEIFEKKEA